MRPDCRASRSRTKSRLLCNLFELEDLRARNLKGIAGVRLCERAARKARQRSLRDNLTYGLSFSALMPPVRRLAVPLPNRVNPFGELCAFCARGSFMGNRGGRFHTDAKTLTSRRWASRQWICCVLDFKGRRRDVWGRFYTELFFLDEPTALATGHRPGFECHRKDADTFAEKWRQARRLNRRPYATCRSVQLRFAMAKSG
jgi:hypothetical protein